MKTPSMLLLPDLLSAMDEGFSPNTLDVTPAQVFERKREIEGNKEAFVRQAVGVRDKAFARNLPPGRIPSKNWWIYDKGFVGSVQLRWQPGTALLPSHVLGHIGYAIRPTRRGNGYAYKASCFMCEQAKSLGMEWVDISCFEKNYASRRVIEKLGGKRAEEKVDERGLVFVYRIFF